MWHPFLHVPRTMFGTSLQRQSRCLGQRHRLVRIGHVTTSFQWQIIARTAPIHFAPTAQKAPHALLQRVVRLDVGPAAKDTAKKTLAANGLEHAHCEAGPAYVCASARSLFLVLVLVLVLILFLFHRFPLLDQKGTESCPFFCFLHVVAPTTAAAAAAATRIDTEKKQIANGIGHDHPRIVAHSRATTTTNSILYEKKSATHSHQKPPH